MSWLYSQLPLHSLIYIFYQEQKKKSTTHFQKLIFFSRSTTELTASTSMLGTPRGSTRRIKVLENKWRWPIFPDYWPLPPSSDKQKFCIITFVFINVLIYFCICMYYYFFYLYTWWKIKFLFLEMYLKF